MCADGASAEAAETWVVGVASVLFPGEWRATTGELGTTSTVRLFRG